MDGLAGGGADWAVLLFDVAANRKLVVCGGISRLLGLGRDICLFGAGQRDGVSGASAEDGVSRAGLAYGRGGGAGGELALLYGDCCGVGGVCESVSGSEIRNGCHGRKTFTTVDTEDRRVVRLDGICKRC